MAKRASNKIVKAAGVQGASKIMKTPDLSVDKLYEEILDEYLTTGEFIKSIRNVQRKYNHTIPLGTIDKVTERISEYAKQICENVFEEVIFRHCIIYNNIYRYCELTGFPLGFNKALFQKEKLLGLHLEDETLVINNEMDIVVGEGFNFELLSNEEKNRLEELIVKCKPIKQLKNASAPEVNT